MTGAERASHDEERLDYHTRMAVVATSTLQQVVHAGRRLTLLNRHAISARRGLVASLETALRLRSHRTGSLADLDRYLHDRTGGMIGSLSHIIRGAAVEAILTGAEAITKTVLERVELDHAADSQHATAGKKRRR